MTNHSTANGTVSDAFPTLPENPMHNAESPTEVTDRSIESLIRATGKTAPRITPMHVDACILKAEYHVFPGTQLTVCCMTLMNGSTVTGESACASPENFDKGIAEQIAYQQAKQKIWALEGYRLKCDLADEAAFVAAAVSAGTSRAALLRDPRRVEAQVLTSANVGELGNILV